MDTTWKMKEIFEFAEFRLIPAEGLLLRNGEPVPLSPKAFEVLVMLLEHHGHLVQKNEIIEKVWEDAFVEEAAISKSIWAIRQALGEDSASPQFIQTAPRRGYRFVAPVMVVNGSAIDSRSEHISSGYRLPRLVETNTRESESNVETTRSKASNLQRNRSLKIPIGIAAGAFILIGFYFAYSWWTGTGINSLAVLPLENLSGDPSQDYLAAGMTEALTGDLAKISALRVLSRPSVVKYAETLKKEGLKPVTDIGRDLGVDAVVTGSVSRSGDRIRITVQLTHAPTDRNLWSKSYERDLREVLVLQSELARTMAGEIRVNLTPQEQSELGSVRPVEPEAYIHYSRGRFYLNKQNEKDQATTIAALEKAVEIDPTFAIAHAELAQAYVWMHFSFKPKESDLAEKAWVATERAFALDPNLAAAYLARGRLQWTPGNRFPHEKAIKDYHRALDLDPQLDEARNQLALVYCHIGALDEALKQSNEGVTINPTNNLFLLRIGQTLNFQTNYEQAFAVLSAIPKEVHPSVVGHQTAWALLNLGRREESNAKIEQLIRDEPDRGGTFASVMAVTAALEGRHQDAEFFIKQAIENGKGFGHFHHTAYTIACAYALMNKREEAIRWLEAAADDGFPCYPLFEKDGNLDNLRQDPRFAAFLTTQKQQWEYFKSIL